MGYPLNFDEIKKAAQPFIADIAMKLLPNAMRQGKELVATNPKREDKNPGSFSINYHTGDYADFAVEGVAGDLIGFVGYINDSSPYESAKFIADFIGYKPNVKSNTRPMQPKKEEVIAISIDDIPSFPTYIPPKISRIISEGGKLTGTEIFPYLDLEGRLYGACLRWNVVLADGSPDKDVRPASIASNKKEWLLKRPDECLPYNAHQILARPDSIIIIVEGEKAALALSHVLSDCIVITTMGGSGAAGKSNLACLHGRVVIVWADHDVPGSEYAESVIQLSIEAGATVNNIDLTKIESTFGITLMPNDDVADLIEREKWTAVEFAKAFAECTVACEPPKPEPTTAEKLEQLISEVTALGSPESLFENSSLDIFIDCSIGQFSTARNRLKAIFKERLNLNDLNKAMKIRKGETTPSSSRPQDTFVIAQEMLSNHFPDNTLLYHNGDFLNHTGTKYERLNQDWLKSEVYKAQAAKNPDMSLVNNVIDAIKGLVHVKQLSLPFWRNGSDPANTIAFNNGLLDISTFTLMGHTPDWVSENVLPYDYDPSATCPLWESKLAEVFADQDARDEIQKWFGYNLTTSMSYHVIAYWLGVKRAFKSTMANVLRAIIGENNVVAPTFASLGTQFGLADFVGKQSAIFFDAHVEKNQNQTLIVEKLKTISGNDAIQIERKYQNPYTTKLTTRITIISNAPIQFNDESGAMGSRLLVFPFMKSFEKNQDPDLFSKLLQELPGIVNWALKGLVQLRADKCFKQPQCGSDFLDYYKSKSSPISEFIDECCDTPVSGTIECQELRNLYYNWARGKLNSPLTGEAFGRALSAAYPYIIRKRVGPQGDQEYHYSNIAKKR